MNLGLGKEVIEQHWPLTAVSVDEFAASRGGRAICRIRAREGRFLLKVAAASRPEALVQKDTQILEFLAAQGFAAPHLLRTRGDAGYQAIGGCFVYAMEYIGGQPPPRSPESYQALGRLTATLHAITAPYPHRTDFGPAGCLPETRKRAHRFGLGREYHDLADRMPDLGSLPATLIHTDVGLYNIIRDGGGRMVLIDWDDAGIGPAVLDLGWVLMTCIKNRLLWLRRRSGFEKELAAAFFSGYTAVRALSPGERDHLVDAALFYGLNYTVPHHDQMDGRYWSKTRFVVRNRELLLSALTP